MRADVIDCDFRPSICNLFATELHTARIIQSYTITFVMRGVFEFVSDYQTRFPTMTRLLISDEWIPMELQYDMSGALMNLFILYFICVQAYETVAFSVRLELHLVFRPV